MDDLPKTRKIIDERVSLKATILLGIILGAIVYGSIKVIQMGGINP